MGRPFLIVNSITNAMKSRSILEKQGFVVSVERTQGNQNPQGCSYSVQIIKGNSVIAENLLVSAGIEVVGRYNGVGK